MAAPYYKVKERFRFFSIKISEKNREEIRERIKSRYTKADIGKSVFLYPEGLIIEGWYGQKGAYGFTQNLSGANFRGFSSLAAAKSWLIPTEPIPSGGREPDTECPATDLPPWE